MISEEETKERIITKLDIEKVIEESKGVVEHCSKCGGIANMTDAVHHYPCNYLVAILSAYYCKCP